MAGTGSPQSEPRGPGAAPEDRRREALARFLAEASGAATVEISGWAPLRGGAIQENWAVDAYISGGAFAGEQRLVLRTAAPTGVAASLGRIEEFAVLEAAFAAGVTVPEPLWASDDPEIMGKPFFTMRRVEGTAAAHRITRDPALDPALPMIAGRLGRELARIHTIRPPRADLAFLAPHEKVGPAHQIAGFRAYLDGHPTPRPVLEWEFSGWGDPHEDIGWFCSKGWRFARPDREAGGIADRAPFYHGYESESGRPVDPRRVFFWEVLASIRWAVIALQQSDRYMIGGERNLDLALTGRRATECELEILMLLDPGGVASGA